MAKPWIILRSWKIFKKLGNYYQTFGQQQPLTISRVDPSDKATNFKSFTDAKLGAKWLESHVHVSKYLLQMTKCKYDTCCKPLRTNVQEVLGRKILAHSLGPI